MLSSPNYLKHVKTNLKFLNNFERIQWISLGKSVKCNKKEPPGEGKKGNDPTTNKQGEKEYPEEPTTCCMSGCANCVWLEYAQKLTEYYKDGGEQALKEINEKVTDQNIKAFLLHELRMRNIKSDK